MASLRSQRITRRSKQKEYYSDFALNFDLNPVTGNLHKLTNEDAIKQSIVNLIMTNRGERFYYPDVGSDVLASLFEMDDDITATKIQTNIVLTLQKYEPRAQNVQCLVIAEPQNNLYRVDLTFSVINIPEPVLFSFPITNRIR